MTSSPCSVFWLSFCGKSPPKCSSLKQKKVKRSTLGNDECPLRRAHICVFLVILVVTVTVKFWEHNHCLRTFTATVAYYIARLSPHRPNGVHTIFNDAILNLFWCWLLSSWYVFLWVWLPPPYENMWQIWSNDGGKEKDRRYLYIYNLFTPIHNVGSYTLKTWE